MKKTIAILFLSLVIQNTFCQISKSRFNKFWALNANIGISKKSSLDLGVSFVLDDTSSYFGLHKDNRHVPPSFSTWIISYKHNFWFGRLDDNLVRVHQLSLEWHHWDLGEATIFGDFPKTFKLNYFFMYAKGKTENVISPEIGLSLVTFQLTYRHNFFLTANSEFEDFIGIHAFTINFLLPLSKNALKRK